MVDWPGELDFYRRLASRADGTVIEIACGTGRVTIPLTQAGVEMVGLDHSTQMLAEARRKSASISNVRWVQADMRSFDLAEHFALAIIPGHSFQNLLTGDDQLACLEQIGAHLRPGGKLVVHLDHQDVDWLGDLFKSAGGVSEPSRLITDPATGRQLRVTEIWSYERADQTAVLVTRWEEVKADGSIGDHWQTDPVRIHCVFRLEMEHLLGRAGYSGATVFGDFFESPLTETSSEMIWVASWDGRQPR
jgi:SAM-dependent methyltransferase